MLSSADTQICLKELNPALIEIVLLSDCTSFRCSVKLAFKCFPSVQAEQLSCHFCFCFMLRKYCCHSYFFLVITLLYNKLSCSFVKSLNEFNPCSLMVRWLALLCHGKNVLSSETPADWGLSV